MSDPSAEGSDSDRSLGLLFGGSVVAAFLVFGIASQVLHNPVLDIGLGILPLLAVSAGLFWGRSEFRAPLLTAQVAPATWALYQEVVNFNKIVRSLAVSDQLQRVGNPGLPPAVRQNLLKALQLVRQDLIRAIKTERILRENQDVIDELLLGQADLFANNLASLQALQLEGQAAEVEQYLTSAVQIALEVRDRLQELQSNGD
ncbi:MAG: hypothetical protein F6J87_21200 [Spirulina sp. SIO3F2]|nr:hypothetical protein [Spirulina sp. SIO3F2]